VVCTAVLHGFPVTLTRPFTTSKLVGYANAAAAPTRRTVISLGRLERLGDARALASLVTAWQQLQTLDASVGTLTRDAHTVTALGRQILARRQHLSALAQFDRLPACGVTDVLARP
jgi:hypothetical protein